MLQVILTTDEVVDIDGDAVTFAGPWAEFTRGPIPVASVGCRGRRACDNMHMYFRVVPSRDLVLPSMRGHLDRESAQ